jgi:hypothetical protein
MIKIDITKNEARSLAEFLVTTLATINSYLSEKKQKKEPFHFVHLMIKKLKEAKED